MNVALAVSPFLSVHSTQRSTPSLSKTSTGALSTNGDLGLGFNLGLALPFAVLGLILIGVGAFLIHRSATSPARTRRGGLYRPSPPSHSDGEEKGGEGEWTGSNRLEGRGEVELLNDGFQRNCVA